MALSHKEWFFVHHRKLIAKYVCPFSYLSINHQLFIIIIHFSEGAVEPLKIPDGVSPGDRIAVDGYQGTPDVQLNPKKKVWEKLSADLKTNDSGEATWQNNFLLTSDGQKILAGLANVSIK